MSSSVETARVSWLHPPNGEKEAIVDAKLQGQSKPVLSIKDIGSLYPVAVRDPDELEYVFRRMIVLGLNFSQELSCNSGQQFLFLESNEESFLQASPLSLLENDLFLGEKKMRGKVACQELFDALEENTIQDKGFFDDIKMNIREGIKARDTLMFSNMGLIGFVIKTQLLSYTEIFSFEELNSAGMEGLMEAIERYDPSYKVRFCTYAGYRIRFSLQRFVKENFNSLSGPKNARVYMQKIEEAKKILAETKNAQPTTQEIAAAAHLQIGTVEGTLRLKKFQDIRFLDEAGEEISGDSICPSDYIGRIDIGFDDVDAKDAFHTYMKGVLKNFLLTGLTKQQQSVLSLRLTVFPYQQTLRDISERLHISRERVRQIIKEIMKVMQVNNPKEYEEHKDVLIAILQTGLNPGGKRSVIKR